MKPAELLRQGSKEYEDIDDQVDKMEEEEDFKGVLAQQQIEILSLYEHGKSCFNKPILTLYLRKARRVGWIINNFIIPDEEGSSDECANNDAAGEFDVDRNDVKSVLMLKLLQTCLVTVIRICS